MTTAEILKKSRDLIAKGWTQKTLARDVAGNPHHYWDKGAECFCALGAVYRACHDTNTESAMADKAFEVVTCEAASRGYRNGVLFNDAPEMTQEKVLALFDSAIGKLGGL